MNKSVMGWIVAAVLAVVLMGVLVFQVAGGGGTRTAALRTQDGQGPPPDVAADIERIKADKDARGSKGQPPKLEAGQEGTRLDANPQGPCDPALPPNVFAEWRNYPNNLNEASGQATQIFVGTVQEVTNGAGFGVDVPNEPGGRFETPTQNVRVRVDDFVKGRGAAGETVTIESLGDGDRGCYRVAGDPPYRRGEQYLLLVQEGKGGRPSHVISPAGRWRVGADSILQAMEDNPKMADVARQKLADVVAKLRARG